MLDILQEHYESEAIRVARNASSRSQYYKNLSVVHHVFSFIICIIAFLVVLIFLHLSESIPSHKLFFNYSGITIAGLLILISQFLKRNSSVLIFLRRLHLKPVNFIKQKVVNDPFYFSLITSIAIYISIAIFIMVIVIPEREWIEFGSAIHSANIPVLNHHATFSLTILTIQTALFAFILGQLLSKYSSKISGAMIKHPAILLSCSYPIIIIISISVLNSYAYPKVDQSVITFGLLFINLYALIASIIIVLIGIHPNKVIRYATTTFCNKLPKVFKPCTVNFQNKPDYIWRVLNFFGLDWRDGNRMRLYEPPPAVPLLLKKQLVSLFNIAHKAIQENNEELLQESLVSILQVIQVYTGIRTSYYGNSDSVFDYTRNQISAILKASSKSLNESMIDEVVKAIGIITIFPLEIKRSPDVQYPAQTSHELSLFWCGLLEEAFDLSHTLMNCTAASNVISQLQNTAIQAINKQQYMVIPVSFVTNIARIYRTCIANLDSYHRILACECIRSSMNVWAYASSNPLTRDRLQDYYFQQFADSIQEMANINHEAPSTLVIDFNNAPNILASRVSRQQFIIQDVFYFTMSRKFSQDWHLRIAVKDLQKIIQLLKALADHSLQRQVIGYDHYITALYEISYLVLRGLPDRYCQSKKVDTECSFNVPPTPNQQVLEEDIFAVWPKLFTQFYKGDIVSLQGPQTFFAILGLGICAFKEREDENLKSKLLLCITAFRDLMLTEHKENPQKYRDHWWAYLRLVGAWTHFILEEETIGNDIAETVGKLPFSYGMHGINTDGRYGHLGYPTMLHSDFFIPAMNNLREQQYLSDADWDKLRECQDALMNDEILISYYKIVEKTRKPLRDQFYERIRKAKEQEKPPECS
ncbi:MAG: hypothetical protein ACYTFK_02410 [Planctomycetota bacterium]|jgi:hypothetical protein